jgi:hypothetical protein
MPLDSSQTPRKDTRGLPEGFDPHHLYEYRYEKLRSSPDSALEWLLYKYIPFSLIRSFAFAIDPTARFKVAPGVITATNRIKYRQTASVLALRTVTNTHSNYVYSSGQNYQGLGGCTSPFLDRSGFSNPTTSDLQDQEPLPDKLEDTTGRTRLFGSKQGELTMFKAQIVSPSRTVRLTDSNSHHYTGTLFPNDPCIIAGGTINYVAGGDEVRSSVINGQGATLSLITYNALRESEKLYNQSLIENEVVGMIKGYSPQNRSYTLFRNVAELRDIPRSVLSLKDTLANLRKLYVSLSASPSLRKIIFDLKKTSADIPNEYLSFHFGWKQTYKDLLDLMAAPEKIARNVNFLLSRGGKPTTFRSTRKFVSGESGVSGFAYETLSAEYITDSSEGVFSRIERSSELRLVINATFDFPPVSAPRFAYGLYLKQLGIIPRPTDVYNLVPWTWLVDYFTGFGNYLECIENLWHDPNLINWGMITCETTGKLISDHKSKSYRSVRRYESNVEVYNNPGWIANRHTSVLEYVCQTRRDVASVLDVNATADPVSLTAYQQSIIGALLLQRSNISRPNSFRGR